MNDLELLRILILSVAFMHYISGGEVVVLVFNSDIYLFKYGIVTLKNLIRYSSFVRLNVAGNFLLPSYFKTLNAQYQHDGKEVNTMFTTSNVETYPTVIRWII